MRSYINISIDRCGLEYMVCSKLSAREEQRVEEHHFTDIGSDTNDEVIRRLYG
jgi:hypothetical protein